MGPKRLHTVLGHVALAKAQLEKTSRNLKSQLEAELESRHPKAKADSSQEAIGASELSADPRNWNVESSESLFDYNGLTRAPRTTLCSWRQRKSRSRLSAYKSK
jgi:hypothetical protein